MTQSDTLDILLNINAIHFYENTPFVWSSGWNSPIYCDNRLILSQHEARKKIRNGLVALAKEHFPAPDAIAGVATGAIAMGALVADALEKPFAYVRPKPKDHGMGNQIEGVIQEGSKVLIVEDLISTGGSSLKAVEALRRAGSEVLGMVAVYTHGFPQAEEAFAAADLRLVTLSHYDAVIAQALATGYISPEDEALLKKWRKAPDQWTGRP